MLLLLCTVVMVALVLLAGEAYRCSTRVDTVTYTLETDLTRPIRIVHLTDLHGWFFGEDNARLAELVKQQEPDLILMTGDMLDSTDPDASAVLALIAALRETAPIYFCYGNHEKQWEKTHGASLAPALTEAGAVVLDIQYLDVTVRGQQVRIGGYHGYWRQGHMLTSDPEQIRKELDFARDFEDTDRYKILLCHIPTAWLDWGYIHRFPVDLVLSGHYHGGLVRLPGIGGLVAPYVGLFPPYTQGLYTGRRANCVLSAGLGSNPGLPRLLNPPQMVVVELVPRDKA